MRPTLSAGVLFTLYFTLPLDRAFTGSAAAILLAGLVAFGALIVYQVRAILHSPHPRLAGITALATTVPAFVVSFSTVYFVMGAKTPSTFTEPLSRVDALYFTVTVLATVGFGDIVARTEIGRGVATLQMIGDLLLFGVIARVLLNAVQAGLATRAATSHASASGDADVRPESEPVPGGAPATD